MEDYEECILKLEKSLFEIEFFKDKDYLNRIIDDEYMELGKSGKLYTKEDEIRAFGEMTEDRDITIYNYSCMKLSEDVFLIHYYTKSEDSIFFRTSIWKKIGLTFSIVFHQASKYMEPIELVEF